MADMGALADVANLATTGALLVALIFGVAQLVAARREGRQRATVEVVRALQTPGFIQAQQRVLDLPPDLSRDELRARGAFEDAVQVAYFYESLGVLAHRGVADLDIVLDLYHVDHAWARLRRFVEEQRATHGDAHVFEWFQWLADEDERHSAREGPAAYERGAGRHH